MRTKVNTHQYNFADVYGRLWETHPNTLAVGKKDDQLSIEDCYDTSILGVETEEDVVRRKMKQLPKCRIMLKTTVSGDRVEVDLYPYYLNRADIPRSQSKQESRLAQKKLNAKNGRKQLIRLMCANFHSGDLLVTLTYKDNYYPTLDRARKDMKNYLAKLRKYRKEQGLSPLKYIYVIEYQDETESTKKIRIHHHLIINNMDRDIVETLWTKGRAEAKYAQPDDFELEGFARYITKLSMQKGHHSYVASKNLDKPKEYKTITKLSRKKFADIIKSGDDKQKLMESLFRDQFRYLDSKTYISDEYGGFYLYSRMRRKQSVWKDDAAMYTHKSGLRCRAFLNYDYDQKSKEAVCSVVLEAKKDGKPLTQKYYARLRNTTKTRALLYMAKVAVDHLKPCCLEIHSGGNALFTGLTLNRFKRQQAAGYEKTSNADLIEALLAAGKEFKMIAVKGEDIYETSMAKQRKALYDKMPVVEDKHE